MDKLYSPAIIKKICEKYDFRLSKSLGQNFLVDGNIVDKIIEAAAVDWTDIVIEIGPGIGVLTNAAAKKAAYVIGIEIDSKLIPVLQETLSDRTNVRIINQDFMKTDLGKVLEDVRDKGNSLKIIGNLPYYITTPIIMKILEDGKQNGIHVENMTIMMQKEVAERIAALPGTKAYGALSVAVQYYCHVQVVTTVPKQVFIPKPKVDSTVLNLVLRKHQPVHLYDERIFFLVVKTGFGKRRKTLGNALTGLFGLNKAEIELLFNEIEIESGRRAETLSIEEFADIANGIYMMMESKGLPEGSRK